VTEDNIHTESENQDLRKELGLKEEILKELNAIIESVSDGVYVTDGLGKTLKVNPAFEQITDIKAPDVVGLNVEQLISAGIYDKSVSLDVLKTGEQCSMVEILKNGKEILLTGTPVFNKNGQIFRVVTTLRDMAELNTLKKELAKSVENTTRYRMELLNLRLQQLDMEDVVVQSEIMKNVMRLALRLSEVDSNILISGESGVGKEIVAKAIHRAGRGENYTLITANCGAIPENLLESELFGYEKGAFTGAEKTGKPGLFETAKGGTLFLDEIGDVSLNIQVKLLRAIQEKEVMRVGARKSVKVDVRIIAATNRDLKDMVEQGSFRRDLFFRLNVVPIYIPPLRERQDDILPLITYFLAKFNKKFGKEVRISSDVLRQLIAYSWPGNVRELENTLERLVVLSSGSLIRTKDLTDSIQNEITLSSNSGPRTSVVMPLSKAREILEKQLFEAAWKKYKTTRRIAAALEISQSTVVRKLDALGIGTKD